jgi:isopenicillin-N N-acyltransferase-like protein
MITRFTSSGGLSAAERGAELGAAFGPQVKAAVERYARLFGIRPADRVAAGARALDAIDGWAPELAREIRGIAAGAGVAVEEVAALNARTEILALGRRAADGAGGSGLGGDPGAGGRGECSTVVALGGPGAEPVAGQNWDWYAGLADGWLVWDIPRPDGRRTVTLTEYGIVGKIGINSSGVGCLFNILHHRRDGAGVAGVPVHVIARRLLDEADDVAAAVAIAGAARVTASTAITVAGGERAGKAAVTLEVWPGGPDRVLPGADGLLLRTNHFLAPRAALGDTGPATAPDTLARLEVLRRRLAGQGRDATADLLASVLSDHTGGAYAICSHPPAGADGEQEFQTLASVRLDFAACDLDVTDGPPCGGG